LLNNIVEENTLLNKITIIPSKQSVNSERSAAAPLPQTFEKTAGGNALPERTFQIFFS
jgi:hypothetical protein